mmetsp:Transcript_20743/g.49428  ORF Transcript_20743/g.49428 Transcript_20743/m.49428 type:complete len:209 (-) Transcript_20743:416-1042(-)
MELNDLELISFCFVFMRLARLLPGICVHRSSNPLSIASRPMDVVAISSALLLAGEPSASESDPSVPAMCSSKLTRGADCRCRFTSSALLFETPDKIGELPSSVTSRLSNESTASPVSGASVASDNSARPAPGSAGETTVSAISALSSAVKSMLSNALASMLPKFPLPLSPYTLVSCVELYARSHVPPPSSNQCDSLCGRDPPSSECPI